uniref:RH2 domain-containing protein n=1 Tax=Bubo bubo TaxID=30461 RepID=A0A8C0IBN9_BUBBB
MAAWPAWRSRTGSSWGSLRRASPRKVGVPVGLGSPATLGVLGAQGCVGHSLKLSASLFPLFLLCHLPGAMVERCFAGSVKKPRSVVGSGVSLGPGACSRLSPPCLGSDSTARKEREVMLRLKEVVDKQRDELRAQAHEIVCKSRDTEAVRVWELLGVVREGPGDLLSCEVLGGKARRVSEDEEGLSRVAMDGRSLSAPSPTEELQRQDVGRSPAHCCFSKEELQQILQERNELKTNLFLVQEELAYYQRELLNEERVPSFFLDAMKSTIKRQRKKIRAKMLGTVEESATSRAGWMPASRLWCFHVMLWKGFTPGQELPPPCLPPEIKGLMSAVDVLLWLSPGSTTGAGLFAATRMSLSPVTRGLARCHLSPRGCGKGR